MQTYPVNTYEINRTCYFMPEFDDLTDYEEFGPWLRRERKARKISTRRFAEMVGVQHSHIINIELHGAGLSEELAIRIAEALGLDSQPVVARLIKSKTGHTLTGETAQELKYEADSGLSGFAKFYEGLSLAKKAKADRGLDNLQELLRDDDVIGNRPRDDDEEEN